MLYPFVLLLPLYILCYATYIYHCDLGHGLPKELGDVYSRRLKGEDRTAKISLAILSLEQEQLPLPDTDRQIFGLGTEGIVCL